MYNHASPPQSPVKHAVSMHCHIPKLLTWLATLLLAIIVFLRPLPASSQSRVSDRDVEALMSNVKEDSKSFRARFDAAIQKSAIRRTSEEKEAKNTVARFQKQSEAMLDSFKRTKKGDEVPNTLHSADQVEKLVEDLKVDSSVASSWQKIREELNQISRAFGISQQAASSPPLVNESSAGSCLQTAGAERAKRLADECMQVSPATHPPCNVQNPCNLIMDEIKRSCDLLGHSAPPFCDGYR